MTNREMKRQVLEMAQKSYAEGLFAGTSGNLSLRNPETGLVAITPGSVAYPTMTPDDIVLLTPEGQVAEGARTPSSEWRMHAGIYQRRDDLHAVVHTHSPNATAFAVVQRAIPAILIEMLFFLYGDVPVAPYGRPGTDALAEAVLPALQRRTACLLANHGVLAVGETLEQAHLRAVYVEDAATICAAATQLGSPVEIPPEEQNAIRRRMGIPEED